MIELEALLGRFERLDAKQQVRVTEEFVSDRFSHVRTPSEPGAMARKVVDALETALVSSFPDQSELLKAFVLSLRDCVEAAWPTKDELLDEEVDPREAAQALITEVEQLEDLVEALQAGYRTG